MKKPYFEWKPVMGWLWLAGKLPPIACLLLPSGMREENQEGKSEKTQRLR